jgi:single-strand DNA-binding protein
MIEGRLQTRSWQDNAGNQKYRTEIITERMQLGPKSAGKIAPKQEPPSQEEIPIVEEETEIDVKDIPF